MRCAAIIAGAGRLQHERHQTLLARHGLGAVPAPHGLAGTDVAGLGMTDTAPHARLGRMLTPYYWFSADYGVDTLAHVPLPFLVPPLVAPARELAAGAAQPADGAAGGTIVGYARTMGEAARNARQRRRIAAA